MYRKFKVSSRNNVTLQLVIRVTINDAPRKLPIIKTNRNEIFGQSTACMNISLKLSRSYADKRNVPEQQTEKKINALASIQKVSLRLTGGYPSRY